MLSRSLNDWFIKSRDNSRIASTVVMKNYIYFMVAILILAWTRWKPRYENNFNWLAELEVRSSQRGSVHTCQCRNHGIIDRNIITRASQIIKSKRCT